MAIGFCCRQGRAEFVFELSVGCAHRRCQSKAKESTSTPGGPFFGQPIVLVILDVYNDSILPIASGTFLRPCQIFLGSLTVGGVLKEKRQQN